MKNKKENSGREKKDEKKPVKNQQKDVVPESFTPATEKVKPHAGHSLRNDGTNVSYDEDR